MNVYIVTLFPAMFQGPLTESILKRATEQGLVQFHLVDLRDFATDKHRTCDDTPFGGGPGMVLKPEPAFAAVERVREEIRAQRGDQGVRDAPVILLTPQGKLFNQSVAVALARCQDLVLLCGHYEGVDERVAQHLATLELSIGDYILTGGELAAMVVADAVVRLLPGALHAPESPHEESFVGGLLEAPQYTRPAEFRGWKVPDVLLSGDHAKVARWRRQQGLLRTWQRRPDLLARSQLSLEDRRFLDCLRQQLQQGHETEPKISDS
ncbi:MAG: tRNA (guanosine(37)-N1)-methyltransferase TrmD [Chloroflexi bacterium]|nr:tRNA (guanosine(37)-N1)-methyltransferase TrmD [Chloroflexota bacterium]